MVMVLVGDLHQCLCTVSRADRFPGSCSPACGHVFACLLWIVVIHLLWAWGGAFFRAFVPAAKALSGAYEEGIAGMLTIIKASLLGSALMLLELYWLPD
jgi:hypothetical protein